MLNFKCYCVLSQMHKKLDMCKLYYEQDCQFDLNFHAAVFNSHQELRIVYFALFNHIHFVITYSKKPSFCISGKN